ncbi:urease accessory protein UreH domain-containing protein [Rosettibacter firmus]|uniref:urease accessory protein UreH domain-containing protein n=1 Tax=Rosettibacter firmus TaxID=3111522 RepID=UPI00336BC91E
MNNSLLFLSITTAFVGFSHTVLGPDHYLPFIAIAKSRNWSLKKTIFITFLCGIGHILSSVIISFIGIIFGFALNSLKIIDSIRAEIAAWLLICFGLIYFLLGIKKCWRKKSKIVVDNYHSNLDVIKTKNNFEEKLDKKNVTAWILFIIFIFGPCESLIPLLLYPSIQNNLFAIIIITLIFSITTIGTMLIIVITIYSGLSLIKLESLEKYSFIAAGFLILICGLAIEFLGL